MNLKQIMIDTKNKFLFLFFLFFALEIHSYMKNNKQLLILSPPSVHSPYYKQHFQAITNFYIHYVNQIINKDEVLILLDEDTYFYYKNKIPIEKVYITNHMDDIWMRDFTSVDLKKPIQFRYTESYLGKKIARKTQKNFNQFLKKLELKLKKSKYFLDGGNFVDYEDKVIISNRFIEDNLFQNPQKAKKYIKNKTNKKYISIIPYDDEIMGHADGMVMFVESNKIFVNRYAEPFRSKLLQILQDDFPKSIQIIEMDSKPETKRFDNFYSACGIYVNSVVTNRYIYMPMFDLDLDEKNLKLVQKNTKKQVIPIQVKDICFMGGSVRCLTWQISGKLANRILKKVRQSTQSS